MIYTISNIRVKFNVIVVQLWWFGNSQNGEGKKKEKDLCNKALD
jgi:hypothetical protein